MNKPRFQFSIARVAVAFVFVGVSCAIGSAHWRPDVLTIAIAGTAFFASFVAAIASLTAKSFHGAILGIAAWTVGLDACFIFAVFLRWGLR
jgi:hypothetical protein